MTPELLELQNIVAHTEKLVEDIARILPEGGPGWLEWRHKNVQRRLDDAKRDLREIVNSLQMKLLAEAHENEANN